VRARVLEVQRERGIGRQGGREERERQKNEKKREGAEGSEAGRK
jgi:hypothetical protein